MTPEQIDFVQTSFERAAPAAETLAAAFYARLFEIDPALRPLFKGDIHEQGRRMVRVLAAVVRRLHALDAETLDTVRALARRHVRYGVEESHYATVGAALLDALGATFGDEFTPALRDAWASAYATLSGVMMEAARSPAEAA